MFLVGRRARRSSTALLALRHPRVAALPGGRRAELDEAARGPARGRRASPARRRTRSPTIERRLRASTKADACATCAGRALGLLPIVWVGILLSVFQQFVGINVIFYYSTTLWQSVGLQRGRRAH